MIPASELRIGNYGKAIGFGTIMKCSLITEYGWDEVIPIPLTEQWLLNFGFKNIWKDSYLYINLDNDKEYGNSLMFEKNNKKISIFNGSGDVHTYCIVIQYIHQLQNLFFSLTGQELNCIL